MAPGLPRSWAGSEGLQELRLPDQARRCRGNLIAGSEYLEVKQT